MNSSIATETVTALRAVPNADRMRALALDLGPSAHAVGRYLATRVDLLSADFRRALASLPVAGAALSIESVRALLADRLGADVEQLAWIAPRPLVFDGLVQAHEARTASGRELLVKVRCPAVDVALSSRELDPLVRAVGTLASLSPSDRGDLLAQIRAWVARCVDLDSEREALERMRRFSSELEAVQLPRPVSGLCGAGVLTVEQWGGVPVGELLRDAPDAGESLTSLLGFSARVLGDNAVLALLQQIFGASEFHADSTPGNLVALSGNRVVYLDGSHSVPLDPRFSRNRFVYLSAVLTGDVDRLLDAVYDLAEAPTHEALESFGRAFRRKARLWEQERSRPGGWESTASPRVILTAAMQLIREHGLRLSDSVRAMLCALAEADAVAAELDPRSGLESALRGYLPRQQVLGLVQELSLNRLNRVGLDLLEIAVSGPGNLARLLSDLSSQRFVLRVQAVESDETRAASNLRAKLLANGALLVALAIGAGVLRLGPPGLSLAWFPLAILGALASGNFVLLWIRLR